MRKNAWVICCCTAVLSAFGIFFRWLQDQACFEAETGLAVHGSIWPYVVALMMVISAAAMALFVYLAEKKNMAWLESFSIAGSMLIGMAAAVLVRL